MVKWTSDEIEWCSCNKLKEAEEKAAKWDAIVRCGECEHGEQYKRVIWCLVNERGFDPNHFCAEGERREQALASKTTEVHDRENG